MDEADTDTYIPSVHDKSANRPDSLRDVWLILCHCSTCVRPTSNKVKVNSLITEESSKRKLFRLKLIYASFQREPNQK